MAVLLGALLLGFAGPATLAATSSEPPAWIQDRDGRSMRVRFDPGHRLYAGAGVWLGEGLEGAATAVAIEAGLRLRALGRSEGGVLWKRDHEILSIGLRPTGAGFRSAQVCLYRGTFLRHSADAALTIPTDPPVRLPLWFDVGLAAEVGRVDRLPLWMEPGGAASLVVARGDVLADLWRSPRSGRHLALGLSGGYEVGIQAKDGGTLEPDHRITPLSALVIDLAAQRDDGLLTGRMRAEAAYRWSSRRGLELHARGTGEVEAIALAVNDWPLSLAARVEVEALGGLPRPDVRGLASLRLAVPLP